MPEFAVRYGYEPAGHMRSIEQLAMPWIAARDSTPPVPGEVALPALRGHFEDLDAARKVLVDASKAISGRFTYLFIFEKRDGEWMQVEPA